MPLTEHEYTTKSLGCKPRCTDEMMPLPCFREWPKWYYVNG